MNYDNPMEYIKENEVEKNRKERMLEKALKMEKMNKTEEEPADVDSEDIVEAAKDFEEFVTAQGQ